VLRSLKKQERNTGPLPGASLATELNPEQPRPDARYCQIETAIVQERASPSFQHSLNERRACHTRSAVRRCQIEAAIVQGRPDGLILDRSLGARRGSPPGLS
jgi:hypothetical protein